MLIESAIPFTPETHPRPAPGPLAVVTTLEHFSMITYAVDPDALRRYLAPRRKASFALLDRLGLVPFADQSRPYNVMIQHRTEFTIYLPPRLIPSKPA